MGLRFRKRVEFGPLALNLSKSGISASVKAGPVSWNSRTGKIRTNLPGPFSYVADSGTNITKAQLVEIAKSNGVRGYSKLNKQELYELLASKGLL